MNHSSEDFHSAAYFPISPVICLQIGENPKIFCDEEKLIIQICCPRKAPHPEALGGAWQKQLKTGLKRTGGHVMGVNGDDVECQGGMPEAVFHNGKTHFNAKT